MRRWWRWWGWWYIEDDVGDDKDEDGDDHEDDVDDKNVDDDAGCEGRAVRDLGAIERRGGSEGRGGGVVQVRDDGDDVVDFPTKSLLIVHGDGDNDLMMMMLERRGSGPFSMPSQ